MKFNLWFVVLLALMPIFLLFAGLSAAGGFLSSAEWQVIGLAAAAGLVASHLARRRADEDSETESEPADPDVDSSKGDVAETDTASAGYASPPCFLHELDPSYLGYRTREEVLSLLNELLEAERAGARGVRQMSEQAAGARSRSALRGIAADEARFCAMLSGHVTRLGASPSRRTGRFHAKLAGVTGFEERLKLLNRGQAWVVRRLRDALPGIADDALHADLREMLEAHQRNIEQCERVGHAGETMAVE